MNKINNMKRDIEVSRKDGGNNFGQKTNQYITAKHVDKNNFENLRKQSQSQRSVQNGMRPSRGKEIAEVMLRRATDENQYYKNKKHTFMGGTNTGPYQNTTPDYLRILEKPNNKVDP